MLLIMTQRENTAMPQVLKIITQGVSTHFLRPGAGEEVTIASKVYG
jgi:hypothetical protein